MCSVHKEVLRLRYDDYAERVSEHHLLRVEAFLKPTGQSPIMAVANIPLSTPELLVQVSVPVLVGPCRQMVVAPLPGVAASSDPPPGCSSRFLEKLLYGKP